MAPRSFLVTFDYRCPFARIGHEHVLDGLAAGAAWDVRFVPFSLSAAKDSGWEREQDSGLLALEFGIAVRDGQPERFTAAHRALFSFRHDRGGNLRDADALSEVLASVGVDVAAVHADLATGLPAKTVRSEHEAVVTDHDVWGVPTFITAGQAAFVRLMKRPDETAIAGAETVERILDMLEGWPELNEFKHTTIDR